MLSTAIRKLRKQPPVSKEEAFRNPQNPWVKAFRRMLKNRGAAIGLTVILFFVFIGVFADFIAPFDPIAPNFNALRQPPSAQHLMGTDKQGRDIMSRLIFGTRISLAVGFLSQGLTILIGTIVGALAGYYGGFLDTVLMRITDALYAFPSMLLLIIIMAAFGRGFINLLVAMSITAWVGAARLVRGQVLQLKGQEFVEAAHAMGTPGSFIILRHMLPNVLGPIMIMFSFGVPAAIMGEAGMSFLGIGLVPPTPSWGVMLNEGFAVLRSQPHVVIFPSLVIVIIMLAFMYLGDGMRDAFDPRSSS
jgi:ABC-type dipeptide/oligopeptide/nickel transport system permease subunit